MIRCDALIVGGGPAGSTCARLLHRAGWNVMIADRARFPRDKVCAGWLTPEVFELLELDPGDYRATGATLQEITSFRTGLIGDSLIETRYPGTVSYAIRRCEFDAFLLRRAAAPVLEGVAVQTIRPVDDGWVINEAIETRVLVGAGGHFCPVARHVRAASEPAPPVVAKEAEFQLDAAALDRISAAPELLFCHDLEGYGWCVRKGEYLNVGIGRRDSRDFAEHVKDFITLLERRLHLTLTKDVKWKGHAYLASGTGPRPLIASGLLLIGDAAGLAYPESGEGIRPAVESGRLAAETLIAAQGRCGVEHLRPYADALQRLHPPTRPSSAPVRAVSVALGRVLLRSRAFTRRVVLDKWFLRRTVAQSFAGVQSVRH